MLVKFHGDLRGRRGWLGLNIGCNVKEFAAFATFPTYGMRRDKIVGD
jgi:hypothetical protein